MIETIAFWLLAALALTSAVATIALRNPIHCALSLIVCLFCAAGLYVTLYAHFLAAMQVLVYAGAIMVLFVFVIMMLNLEPGRRFDTRVTVLSVLAGIIVLALAGKLGRVLVALGPHGGPAVPGKPLSPDFGSVGAVGDLMFKQFLLPFELASLLLLVAVVGAVIIARRRFWREGR